MSVSGSRSLDTAAFSVVGQPMSHQGQTTERHQEGSALCHTTTLSLPHTFKYPRSKPMSHQGQTTERHWEVLCYHTIKPKRSQSMSHHGQSCRLQADTKTLKLLHYESHTLTHRNLYPASHQKLSSFEESETESFIPKVYR